MPQNLALNSRQSRLKNLWLPNTYPKLKNRDYDTASSPNAVLDALIALRLLC